MVEIALPDYLDEINTLIDDGRPGEAMIHARHILEQYPRQIDVYRLLAKVLLDQGEFADAEDLLQRVLSVYPDDFISHAGLAIVRKEQGKTKESLWYMERAFEIEPYNAAIREELNDLYGRRDGLPPERLTLNRAALARLYVKGELYQQAVAELQNLLAEGVRRVDLQVLLAEALWRAGRRVEAVDTCLQVLGQLPNCVQACAIVAEVWLSTGRVEEAQPYLQRLQALTQLSQADLSGDGPIVLAFQAEGAYPLPERLMLERLPEQAALGIVEGEAAEWVDEVSFVEGEDDFDWLRALEGDEEEDAEEPVVAGEEGEEGEEGAEAEEGEHQDEELLGWLRDVVAFDEDAAADEEGEPLLEQPGDLAAGDSFDWLADIDEMALEDASVEDAVEVEEDTVAETPAEPGQEEPFGEEGWGEDAEAEPTGNWSEVFDEEDADLAGASAWLSEPDDGMEEIAGDETDWEEWLEAGAFADEVGEIPEWLADRHAPDDPETGVAGEDEEPLPDWPGEGAGAEPSGEETTETTSGIEAESMMPDDEFDLEELFMGTSEEPRDEKPEEETPETEGQDLPEATTPEEDLDWLKDLGEVAAEDTGPPAGDKETEPTAAGDLPDWLHDDLDAEAGLDDSLDWLDDEEVDGSAEAGEEGADLARSALSDRDEGVAQDASEEEDLSWLDQIAAGEGEPIEEPPTFSWPEDYEEEVEAEEPTAAVAGDEVPEDLDEAMVWLEQLAAQQGAPLDELPSVEQLADEDTGADELFAGMPDDPEEAMAWLEGLADEQEERPEAEFEATQPESEEEIIPATEFDGEEREEDLDWLDDLDAGEEGESEERDAEAEEEPVATEEEEVEADLADAEFEVEGEETTLDWLDDLGAGEEEEEPEWLGEIVEEEPVAFEEEEIAAEPAAPAEIEGEEDEVALDWLDDLDAGEEEEEPARSGEAEAEEVVFAEQAGMPAGLEAEAEEAEPEWLDEMDRDEEPAEAEAGEGGIEVTAVPADELPDWLTDMAPSAEEQPEAEAEDSALRALLVSAEGVDVEEEEIGEEQIDEAVDHFLAEESDEGAAEPEWLDDLGDEESVPELAAEDQALGAEMAAADQDDEMRAWLEEVAAEEGMDELLADLPEGEDEALAYLEELATQFEAEEIAPPVQTEAEPSGLEPEEDLAWMETLAEAAEEPEMERAPDVSETAPTGSEDEVPEDLEEAMAWLEKLAAEQGAPMDELPSLDEGEMMPAAPHTDLEAGEEEPAGEEEAETFVAIGEEIEPELAGAPDEPAGLPVEDADEAMAWLERLAGQEAEADEEAEPAAPLSDLSDEIPDDPQEALAWLEQLAGRPDTTVSHEPAYADEAGEVVEEPTTPAMAQDVAAAKTEAEALQWEEAEVPSEAEDAGETAPEAEETAPEEEMLEEIPEDPDEAMAWLEQLAARQGASLDELPYVQEVAEEVETPEWLAREAAEEEAAQEAAAQERAEEDAAQEWEALAEAEPEEAAPEEAAPEEAAPEEAAPEEAVPDEIVPSEAQVVEVVPEQVVPEETEEIEADEELDWLDEVAERKATRPVEEGETPAEPPAVAASGEKEEKAEAFDFDLPDVDDESLPDWLAFDEEGETAEFEWDEAAADVTGWLTAEEEVTRHGPEEEPLAERALRPPEQEGRPEPAPAAGEAVPAPLPAVPAGLDLDEETLAAAREAVNADDYDTAITAYQSLLDSGRGLSLLIADLETVVARAGQQALLRRLLGDAYMRNGQLQKALESYRQALELL